MKVQSPNRMSILAVLLATTFASQAYTKKFEAPANASSKKNTTVFLQSAKSNTEIELLKDPTLSLGVAHGFANTLPQFRDQDCSARWNKKAPSLSTAPWLFWEIAEKTYFCDNQNTPSTDGGNFSFSSADGSKQFFLPNDGSFRMLYDTSKEWRAGCNLSISDGDKAPQFPDQNTTWPHFLIGQLFDHPSQPEKNMWINNYGSLTFKASVRLNSSSKSGAESCPAGSWGPKPGVNGGPNHEIFYIAMILRHKNHPAQIGSKINANQIYALIPMFSSEDGNSHVPGAALTMSDQFGNVVYFSPNYSYLKKGEWVDLTVDVKSLTREALSGLNGTYDQTASPKDYQVLGVLIGWEIWGGYKNDVEIKNLSLKAGPGPNDGKILGHIDSVSTTKNGLAITGWACGKHIDTPIQIHAYAGGQAFAPNATLLGGYTANNPSESKVAEFCGSHGANYRFSIPLTSDLLQKHAGKKIYIHGISPTNKTNDLIANSGVFEIPYPAHAPTPPPAPTHPNSGKIRGYIDGIGVSGKNRQIKGWACGMKITTPIQIHVYAGGPAFAHGSELIGGYTANQPSKIPVAKACESTGKNYRFTIPLSEALLKKYAGKKIYIHGISPTGQHNDLINNSGKFSVPR